MARQTLIGEIQKLQRGKIENEANILNEAYIFQKYPLMATLFNQFKKKDEKWSQLVRETIVADVSSINYMYGRTIQLIRRIGKNPRLFFEIKTEIGTYTLPDRLSTFNKLLELYEDFFCNILPGLTRKFNIEVMSEERKSQGLKGKVQWNRTICDPFNSGLIDTPLLFTIVTPITKFDTPENILLVLSVLRMKHDAAFLLMSKLIDPLIHPKKML